MENPIENIAMSVLHSYSIMKFRSSINWLGIRSIEYVTD
jgi:hypothetical protein